MSCFDKIKDFFCGRKTRNTKKDAGTIKASPEKPPVAVKNNTPAAVKTNTGKDGGDMSIQSAVKEFSSAAERLNEGVRDTILREAAVSKKELHDAVEGLSDRISGMKAELPDAVIQYIISAIKDSVREAVARELNTCAQEVRQISDEYCDDFRSIGSGCALGVNSDLNREIMKMYNSAAKAYVPLADLIISYFSTINGIRQKRESVDETSAPEEILRKFDDCCSKAERFQKHLHSALTGVGISLYNTDEGNTKFDSSVHQLLDGSSDHDGAEIVKVLTPAITYSGGDLAPQIIRKSIVEIKTPAEGDE